MTRTTVRGHYADDLTLRSEFFTACGLQRNERSVNGLTNEGSSLPQVAENNTPQPQDVAGECSLYDEFMAIPDWANLC